MTEDNLRRTISRRHLITRGFLPALAGAIAAVLFTFCFLSSPASSGDSSYIGSAGISAVCAAEVSETAEQADEEKDQPAAPDATKDDGSQSGQDQEKSSGRYFINRTHIIISCVVAFALAVLIAVLQARKKFK